MYIMFILRFLVRSSNHYAHGVVGVGELVGGDLGRVDRDDIVAALAREMTLETPFKEALFQDLQRDLLKIDEVRGSTLTTFPPLFCFCIKYMYASIVESPYYETLPA